MKTLNRLLFYAGMLLFVLFATISCNKDNDSPEPGYEAVMAPGVYALQWENGVASAQVNQGDIVAIFSTAADTEQTFPYTIQSDAAKASPVNGTRKSASLSFPYDLKSYRSLPQRRPADLAFSHAHKHTAKLGSTEIFWTYDLTDMSLLFDLPSIQFTAILKAKGVYCDVYVDEDSALITYEDAEEIAKQFDEVAYTVVTGQFGESPVVDGNARVAIVLPLAFNGGIEDDVNPNGWAAGAFLARDQLPPSDENPYSNYRNVLYLNPGLYNSSSSYNLDKWRPILAHEFHHMVNYNYFGTSEPVPIDEGKSLLAEILTGYGLPYGDLLMWANVVAYQDDPSSISLLQMELAPTNVLGSYGMGLLWIIYLYDRFGSQAMYDMATHTLPGLDGAASVTGIPKEHLFAEWLQANIISGSINDPVFEYKTIDVAGDGGGQYYGTLNGFAALPEQAIPGTETQRHVHAYGLEYFRADATGEVIIKGEHIKAFVIGRPD